MESSLADDNESTKIQQSKLSGMKAFLVVRNECRLRLSGGSRSILKPFQLVQTSLSKIQQSKLFDVDDCSVSGDLPVGDNEWSNFQ